MILNGSEAITINIIGLSDRYNDEKWILPSAPSTPIPAPVAGAYGAVNINCCKMILYICSYHVVYTINLNVTNNERK